MVQENLSEEIIPAVLPQSIEDLREKVALVAKLVPVVQIDVCDGDLTPEASWPYNGDNAGFEKILSEDDGLPFWDVVNFEIDLMVRDPEDQVEKWIGAGAQRIVLHYESSTPEILTQLFYDLKDRGIETSLAIHVETEAFVIDPLVHLLDEVQVMGIEEVGFQGEPFAEQVLPKIQEIRAKYPHLNIAVDGGVNLDTAEMILDAGANRLVAGSAIFQNYDVEENLHAFEDLLYSNDQ